MGAGQEGVEGVEHGSAEGGAVRGLFDDGAGRMSVGVCIETS